MKNPMVHIDTITSSTVYLPGGRNPGFDIIELLEVAAARRRCRWWQAFVADRDQVLGRKRGNQVK
jgi:hypothetical protein